MFAILDDDNSISKTETPPVIQWYR